MTVIESLFVRLTLSQAEASGLGDCANTESCCIQSHYLQYRSGLPVGFLRGHGESVCTLRENKQLYGYDGK